MDAQFPDDMDARLLEDVAGAVHDCLNRNRLNGRMLVTSWPEVCEFLAGKGIRGEVLRPEGTPKNGIPVSQESGIWIRLWTPTSDTFWAVVTQELAMRILVLGELP